MIEDMYLVIFCGYVMIVKLCLLLSLVRFDVLGMLLVLLLVYLYCCCYLWYVLMVVVLQCLLRYVFVRRFLLIRVVLIVFMLEQVIGWLDDVGFDFVVVMSWDRLIFGLIGFGRLEFLGIVSFWLGKILLGFLILFLFVVRRVLIVIFRDFVILDRVLLGFIVYVVFVEGGGVGLFGLLVRCDLMCVCMEFMVNFRGFIFFGCYFLWLMIDSGFYLCMWQIVVEMCLMVLSCVVGYGFLLLFRFLYLKLQKVLLLFMVVLLLMGVLFLLMMVCRMLGLLRLVWLVWLQLIRQILLFFVIIL